MHADLLELTLACSAQGAAAGVLLEAEVASTCAVLSTAHRLHAGDEARGLKFALRSPLLRLCQRRARLRGAERLRRPPSRHGRATSQRRSAGDGLSARNSTWRLEGVWVISKSGATAPGGAHGVDGRQPTRSSCGDSTSLGRGNRRNVGLRPGGRRHDTRCRLNNSRRGIEFESGSWRNGNREGVKSCRGIDRVLPRGSGEIVARRLVRVTRGRREVVITAWPRSRRHLNARCRSLKFSLAGCGIAGGNGSANRPGAILKVGDRLSPSNRPAAGRFGLVLLLAELGDELVDFRDLQSQSDGTAVEGGRQLHMTLMRTFRPMIAIEMRAIGVCSPSIASREPTRMRPKMICAVEGDKPSDAVHTK